MAVFAAFTEADIERLAGARAYERGLDYLDEVEGLELTGTQISASVYGGSKYQVRLRFGAGGLAGDCTCPQGRDGLFCKHCVAVGLSVLSAGSDLRIEEARAERRALVSWLESLPKEDLLAELLGLLDEDRDLFRRFELRAASVNGDATTVRRVVRDLVAMSGRDYIGYGEARGYARDLSQAAAAIEDLVQAGGAQDAIEIAREAIGLLAEAYETVDDSSGSVADAADDLIAAHLLACVAAPPDPVSLGRYLAELLLHDDYGFVPDLAGYVDLLGDRGIATVREVIRAAYAEHPEDPHARYLMESVARAEGDVDALITLYAANLDERGRNHLRIARELDAADRAGEALSWAERGLREAAHPDGELVEYLAGGYAAAGRDDAVLELRRDRFAAVRSLANYQALRQAATASGRWDAERGPALDRLREDARRQRGWDWSGPVLVDALTDDGDLDAALTAAQDTATDDQRIRLADALAETRPADALALYLRAIEPMKTMTGDPVYRRMAGLLLSARACHQALGTMSEFRRYLAVLRLNQKRKRNLMRILDENGL